MLPPTMCRQGDAVKGLSPAGSHGLDLFLQLGNNSSSAPLEKAWELGVLILGDEGNWKEAGDR
jgi:hypothetical protein